MNESPDFRLASQVFNDAIPVDSIREHPGNANEGDVGAISESMDAHGFYGAVLVQKSSGFILAGNHRYRTAVAKGATSLPGFILDCDDDEALRLLAVDNRTTHLATINEAALAALLVPLASSPRGLEGTGYDGDDLDDVVRSLNPPARGNPEDKQDSWPVLAFKLPPDIRDRFYQVTDPSGDETNEGRLYWLIEQQEDTAS